MSFDAMQKRRLMTAASVFAIALGTGFVMQTLSPAADRPADAAKGPELATAAPTGDGPGVQPLSEAPQQRMPAQPPAEAMVATASVMPAPAPAPAIARVAPMPAPAMVPAAEVGTPAAEKPAEDLAAPADACAASLTATASPAAMVHLALSAPCHADAPVTVSHGALRFTAMTDAEGALALDIPAFAAEARFTVSFGGGETLAASASVSDLGEYQRSALLWQGQEGVELHAFENGATYGEPGHVSPASPAAPARALDGMGGFLTLLGPANRPGALMAQVYTVPATGISVSINVEAEVTPANCGREIRARVLMESPGGFAPQPLTAAMPGCDAVGDYLVFQNLSPDTQIAAAN